MMPAALCAIPRSGQADEKRGGGYERADNRRSACPVSRVARLLERELDSVFSIRRAEPGPLRDDGREVAFVRWTQPALRHCSS